MFENIIGQIAADQLICDISKASLAPAMLFEGPPSSGKGSTALELARIVSCEQEPSWNCACPACARHRLLLHPDLLCIGNRSFSAETAAAANAYLRERQSAAARILFIRSVRKLLCRFNPVLWEGESKFSKLGSLVVTIEEELDELDAAPEKNIETILKDTFKLESEGMSESIPIEQIRKASFWSRLAPAGKKKTLLIENADQMKEGARNSLLKLLEEPPETLIVVLCTTKPNALLQTIRSRLRPYHFAGRSYETEKEVIRRVFRNDSPDKTPDSGSAISAYIDSFLPVSGGALKALAAFFAASVSYKAVFLLRKQGIQNLPRHLVDLGKHASAIAMEAGLEKTRECREAVGKIMEKTFNFEIRSLYPRFIKCLLGLVTESQKNSASHSVQVMDFLELWMKCAAEAESSVMVYNQNPGLALERLFINSCRGMARPLCVNS